MAQQLKSDWVLFGTVVAMTGAGLVMIYSASSVVAQLNPRINSSYYYAAHQLLWAAVSFIALMFFKRRDYRMLQSPAWAFGSLGMVLFLQLLVFFLDSKTHRWFRPQGVGTLQPSEFAKPALVIFFAYFVTQKREAINTRRTIVAAALALAVLAATVGLGDLGTAIVLIVPAAVVFYVAGLERKFVLAALAVGALVAVGFVASEPYRMARIVGFLDPEYKYIDMVDPGGKIKNYVSQSVTTRDAGYQLGVTSSIVIQALINMSVVFGMGPTKGIPLPMISAGGSSLMSTLICLGMLLSVSEHSGY
jgi:cell division protein FtsW